MELALLARADCASVLHEVVLHAGRSKVNGKCPFFPSLSPPVPSDKSGRKRIDK